MKRNLIILIISILSLCLFFGCAPNSGGDDDDSSLPPNDDDDDSANDDDHAGDDDTTDDDDDSAPDDPSELTATTAGSAQIDLAWSDNSDNESGFYIQRRDAESKEDWETIESVGSNTESFSDTSVECEGSYDYRIVAYNSAGESQPSNEATATADYCEIAAPANLTAQTVSDTQIDLQWQDNSDNETRFEIERRESGQSTWSTLDTVPADSTAYSDMDVICETTYEYRISACNDGAQSAWSNIASALAGPCILVAPTNLTASTGQTDFIDLTWEDNTNFETGYLVQRQPHGSDTWQNLVELELDTVSYRDQDLGCSPADISYDYRVRAFSNQSYSDWATEKTGSAYCSVAIPSDLTATMESTTEINLTWTNNATNQIGFRIYRDGNEIATVGEDIYHFEDSGLTCEITYQYEISAYSDYLESGLSSPATEQTDWCPVAAPTNLTAIAYPPDRIELTWDDNANNETNFDIYRRESGGDWGILTTLGANIEQYDDTSGDCNQDYEYKVIAHNDHVQSDFSNYDSVLIEGCVINTICYADETVNSENECYFCNTELSLTSWSYNNGALCFDSTWCNGADYCLDGSCNEHVGSPCFEWQQCNEQGNICLPEGVGDLDVAVVVDEDDGGIAVLLGKGNGMLSARRDYNTGDGPNSLAIDDLNNDENLDVVVTNWGGDDFSVLLGNGDGSFSPAINYSAGDGPSSVIIDDLDEDNSLDLVFLNSSDNNISVLLGDGNGTFGTNVNYITGSGPKSASINDLNGDNDLDIAVVNKSDNDVSIFLGNGDGTFLPKVDYETDDGPSSIAIGDLDGDNFQDLVVGNHSSNNISILLGNGDGTFQAQVTYSVENGPDSLAIGYLDNNSYLDIAVANMGSDNVSVLLGNGDGTFASNVNYVVDDQPSYIGIADLNEDGDSDLVVANSWDNYISILIGNGDGTFEEKVDYFAGGPYSIAIKDIDGDSLLDMVATIPASNGISVFMGTGNGTLEGFLYAGNEGSGGGCNCMTTGDFDNDGELDFAYTVYYGAIISVVLGNGDGSFTADVFFDVGSEPWATAVGDVNDDGALDIAVANMDSENVSILLNNGDGTFAPKVDYDTGFANEHVAVGYVNGDNTLDVVACGSNKFSVFLGNGNGTFAEKVDYQTIVGCKALAIGDLNDDGTFDIATIGADGAAIHLNNGDDTFTEMNVFAADDVPESIAIGDMNNDEFQDLVIGNKTSNNVSILLGNGDGTFDDKIDFDTGNGQGCISIGDMDNNGILDIISTNYYSSSVSILEGNGNGTFIEATEYHSGVRSWGITLGYFDSEVVLDQFSSYSLTGVISE